MKIFKKLFPKAHELEAANSRIAELEIERETLAARERQLSKTVDSLTSQVSKQTTEIKDLKGKLRDQNDADLMLVSAKIILATLKGEKPEKGDVQYQQSLLAQQQAVGVGSRYPYGAFGGNALGALVQSLGL